MTAFEQAWALLKSYQTQLPFDDEFTPRGGVVVYERGVKSPYLKTIKPPITPLEERVAERPPVSHIEWNPNTNKYTLRGTGDEELSTLKPGMPMGQSAIPEGNRPIIDYLGETPKEFQRKDYYKKLLTGLLNAGIDINSTNRNLASNKFHKKFLENLPPNLETTSRILDPLVYLEPGNYRRKEDFPTFGDSNLAQRDYGALPIQTIPHEPVKQPIGSYQSLLGDFQE